MQLLVFSERLTCLTPNGERKANAFPFESELLMLLHLRSTTSALQSMSKTELGKSFLKQFEELMLIVCSKVLRTLVSRNSAASHEFEILSQNDAGPNQTWMYADESNFGRLGSFGRTVAATFPVWRILEISSVRCSMTLSFSTGLPRTPVRDRSCHLTMGSTSSLPPTKALENKP